ncbi:uncharacterized protein [Rutidosis leptorrhynchoides]|uniref:uncharacterized protein n=1 Tax=Rutidosis leptorrhynchoides TaxID=125765 RepID=UPI003A9A50D8
MDRSSSSSSSLSISCESSYTSSPVECDDVSTGTQESQNEEISCEKNINEDTCELDVHTPENHRDSDYCDQNIETVSHDNVHVQDNCSKSMHCDDNIEEPTIGMSLMDEETRYAIVSCHRAGKSQSKTQNTLNPRPVTKTNCGARVNAKRGAENKWYVSKVQLKHNHSFSPSKGRFYRCNRVVNSRVRRQLEIFQRAGVRMNKGFNSLVVENGGYENIPFTEKDCRNYIDKVKRLKFGEGDAEAIQSYFMKVQSTYHNFFYAWELDDENRLKSLFWADGRSRTAYEEFGDVVDGFQWDRAEKENIEDFNSYNSWYPPVTRYAMEEQTKRFFTNAKFKEFRSELTGKMYCKISSSEVKEDYLEYEVIEDINVEGTIIKKPFIVWLNKKDSDEKCEVKCVCRLFESRGMLCRHAITVLIDNNVYSLPNRYILNRWRKDVKRRHTKVKVSYSDWDGSEVGTRYNKMCTAFSEVADLASEFEEKCSLVLNKVNELKREVIDGKSSCSTFVCTQESSPSNKDNVKIRDPLPVRGKGRPPNNRLKFTSEKIITKMQKKNKNMQDSDHREGVCGANDKVRKRSKNDKEKVFVELILEYPNISQFFSP